jgi:hypothetical protein
MSVANIDITMDRIKTATPDSRIAVFRRLKKGKAVLDSKFADTIGGKYLIAHDTGLVGVYCSESSFDAIADLRKALK